MDSLPKDLVKHIGSFVGFEDRSSCLLTCKAMAPISAAYGYHSIKCTQETYSKKLTNFEAHMIYLRKIKPMLRMVMLYFVDIDNFECESVNGLQGLRLVIEMKRCKCADKIFASLPYDFEVVILDDVEDLDKIGGGVIGGTHVELTLRRVEHVELLKNERLMSNVGVLNLLLLDNPAELDLSFVKAEKLEVSVNTAKIRIVRPHKITHLQVRDDDRLTEPYELYASFLADPDMTYSKMCQVYIRYCCPLGAWREDNTYYKMMRLLPETTRYFVSPSNHPNSIVFMRSCPAKIVKLLCATQQEYVMCCLINMLEKERTYDVMHLDSNADYLDKRYATLREAFDDLTENSKRLWFWVTYLC
jgi:hypothetical protein